MKNTALITGAAGGIGKEFSKIFASKGIDIVAVDLNAKGLKSLKDEVEKDFAVQVYTIEKNLTHTRATQEIYDEVVEQNIQIDYLINNAGFGGVGLFHERPWEQDLAMIQVNIIASTSLIRLFLPDFISRNSGKILNVSSSLSLLPGPMQAVYFSSKSYVTAFNRAIYGELKGTGVSTTALLPGPTKTGFGDSSGMNKTKIYSKTAQAYDVALDGYKAMMSGELEHLSGLKFTDRVLMKLIPLLPKKMLIDRVRKGQETK